MAGLELKVKATGAGGKFRRGPLALTDRWSVVDARRPDVRAALLEHVGAGVRLHPHDVARLADAGLELKGERLTERTAAAPLPPAPSPAGSGKKEGQRSRAA